VLKKLDLHQQALGLDVVFSLDGFSCDKYH